MEKIEKTHHYNNDANIKKIEKLQKLQKKVSSLIDELNASGEEITYIDLTAFSMKGDFTPKTLGNACIGHERTLSIILLWYLDKYPNIKEAIKEVTKNEKKEKVLLIPTDPSVIN